MNRYRCTIYEFNYTFGEHKVLLNRVPLSWLASAVVSARNCRNAAGKAFVRTVGRVYARKLKELNAPEICIDIMSNWKSFACGLGRTTIWLGDFFFFDNRVETFYIRVKRLSARSKAATQRLTSRRRRLLQALRSSSPN